MSIHDLRYVKTEELIRSAFLSCCREHTVEEIHIKDICAAARISRNAFYGHYESKYQLLEAIYEDVKKRMLDDLTPEIIRNLSRDAMYGVSEWCINSVDKNRDLLKVLARCSEGHFRDLIRSVFIDATLEAVFRNTEEIERDILLRMSKAYISDGLTSIILIWLEDPEKMDAKQLTAFLYDISHLAAVFFYKQIDRRAKIARR